jgi:demethylspheroidene O-methyltransferase
MSLFDAWRERRDRLLASERFQRWAARFPLTRGIARRESRALFDLCAGFVYSQVLYACVSLGVFEMLRSGPRTRADLATRLGLGEPAMRTLLDAAVALRLLERLGRDRYGLGRLGAVAGGSEPIRAMVEHHRLLYADLADPVGLLRGQLAPTRLAGFWSYAARPQGADFTAADVTDYSALMVRSHSLVAEDILDAWPVERSGCVLDVGGGEGAFLEALARRSTSQRLMLFDLPPVSVRARQNLVARGLGERVQVHGGDFRADALPGGADLVSLVRVVHDHDDLTALRLLEAVRAALPAGGTLLIAEPMAGQPGVEAMADAYFGFYLLAMGRGRPRNAAELIALARRAGFKSARAVPTARPLLTSLVVATA